LAILELQLYHTMTMSKKLRRQTVHDGERTRNSYPLLE